MADQKVVEMVVWMAVQLVLYWAALMAESTDELKVASSVGSMVGQKVG